MVVLSWERYRNAEGNLHKNEVLKLASDKENPLRNISEEFQKNDSLSFGGFLSKNGERG